VFIRTLHNSHNAAQKGKASARLFFDTYFLFFYNHRTRTALQSSALQLNGQQLFSTFTIILFFKVATRHSTVNLN